MIAPYASQLTPYVLSAQMVKPNRIRNAILVFLNVSTLIATLTNDWCFGNGYKPIFF
jgi:hypothetical protein